LQAIQINLPTTFIVHSAKSVWQAFGFYACFYQNQKLLQKSTDSEIIDRSALRLKLGGAHEESRRRASVSPSTPTVSLIG
jgi:hypothetical protein